MAQPQRQADVHQDELCLPNKRYALMDANKMIDLDNPLCPNESKIMANILQNHPLRFSIAASSSVPWIYLRFTKLIVGHYMIAFPEISRRVRDKYHNLEHDEMLIENYQIYAEAFRVDVPTTQSQPIESSQGTHRTASSPRSPNPVVDEGESKDVILQDTIQQSIAEQKSHDDLEAKQNEEKVKEHLLAEEIEKLVEGTKNVREDEVDNSILNSQNDPDTRVEPRSYKESLEGKGKEVEETRNTPPPTLTRSTRNHSTLISSDTEKL
ncbi:hypothetical protein Tco_0836826 [Tanacetum coccineum]